MALSFQDKIQPVGPQPSLSFQDKIKPVVQEQAPAPQSLSEQIWSGLAGAAKGVTNSLGLGGASNTIANDLAPAALATDPSIHNKLAAQTYLPQSGLGEHFLSGTQLGLTVPAPETPGVSAGIKG